MHIPGRYTLPVDVVALLGKTKLSARALRLTHGLLYLTDAMTRGYPKLIGSLCHTPQKARCAQLASDVGLPGVKDNRWLRGAIDDLQGTRLFDRLSIAESGRYLEYRPSRAIKDAAVNDKSFARLETTHIAQCRTAHDILFYTLARMHSAKDFPMFSLPQIERSERPAPAAKSPVSGLARQADAPFARPWSETRKSWLASAVRISAMLDHNYLVAAIMEACDVTATSVRVKISHENTRWQPGTLYKFPIGTRPVQIVNGKKCGMLSKHELQRRIDWRQIGEADSTVTDPRRPSASRRAGTSRSAR